jgi:4-hydroxyphenylacetate 3-monooxygenase/anthranilate 3-monooxygenase (FAD)/4-hydroxyphenylacetate 3-monooxygenase
MVRSGAEFIEGLHDERAVWVEGRKVQVTAYKPFAGSVQGMAGYFDWQLRYAEDCIVENRATNEPSNASLVIPRGPADLAARHRAFDRLARYSCGMLGRTPDYVNVTLAGFAARSDGFVVDGDHSYADRLLSYHREVATRDLSLTHALIHPAVDKAIGELEGQNRAMATRVVRRTKDHIVVSGAKVLATLAPFSDDLFVYPAQPLAPDTPPEFALCFSIPVATKGVKILCRDHMGVEASLADRPFSSRFDEQDAFIIFDEVEVPHERVFIDGSVEAYNNCRKFGWMANILQQTCIRAATKLEFAYDLCVGMAKALNSAKRSEVSALLGELRTYGNLTRAAICAAEANAHDYGNGAFFCDETPLRAIKNLMPTWMARANEIIVAIGSHNLLCTPGLESLDDAEVGPLIETYLPGASGVESRERIRIFRTAWDFAGSALGARIALYEQYYLASQGRNFTVEHVTASLSRRENLLTSFLSDLGG